MFRQRKAVAKDEQVNSGDGIHQKLSFDTPLVEAIQWRSYHLECIQGDPDRNGDLIGSALEYSDIIVLSDKIFTNKEFRPDIVDRAASSSPLGISKEELTKLIAEISKADEEVRNQIYATLREGNKEKKREDFERQDETTQRTTLVLLATAKFHHDRDGEAISVESEIDRAMEIRDLKAAHELKNQLRFKQHILHEEKLHKDIKFYMAKALYDCTKAIQVAVKRSSEYETIMERLHIVRLFEIIHLVYVTKGEDRGSRSNQHQAIRETKRLMEETVQRKGQNTEEFFNLMEQINGGLRFLGKNADLSEEELVYICSLGLDSIIGSQFKTDLLTNPPRDLQRLLTIVNKQFESMSRLGLVVRTGEGGYVRKSDQKSGGGEQISPKKKGLTDGKQEKEEKKLTDSPNSVSDKKFKDGERDRGQDRPKQLCRRWAENGECIYGKDCRFLHQRNEKEDKADKHVASLKVIQSSGEEQICCWCQGPHSDKACPKVYCALANQKHSDRRAQQQLDVAMGRKSQSSLLRGSAAMIMPRKEPVKSKSTSSVMYTRGESDSEGEEVPPIRINMLRVNRPESPRPETNGSMDMVTVIMDTGAQASVCAHPSLRERSIPLPTPIQTIGFDGSIQMVTDYAFIGALGHHVVLMTGTEDRVLLSASQCQEDGMILRLIGNQFILATKYNQLIGVFTLQNGWYACLLGNLVAHHVDEITNSMNQDELVPYGLSMSASQWSGDQVVSKFEGIMVAVDRDSQIYTFFGNIIATTRREEMTTTYSYEMGHIQEHERCSFLLDGDELIGQEDTSGKVLVQVIIMPELGYDTEDESVVDEGLRVLPVDIHQDEESESEEQSREDDEEPSYVKANMRFRDDDDDDDSGVAGHQNGSTKRTAKLTGKIDAVKGDASDKFVTKRQLHNMKKVLTLMHAAAFPSDKKIINIFRNQLWQNLEGLTTEDAKRTLPHVPTGRDMARIIKPPVKKTTHSEAAYPGQVLYMDILDNDTIVSKDSCSDYAQFKEMKDGKKRDSVFEGVMSIVDVWKVHINVDTEPRGPTEKIITDNERVLKAIAPMLTKEGIQLWRSPSDRHQVQVEDMVDRVKTAERSLYQSQKYPLLKVFKRYLRASAIKAINATPTEKTGDRTTPQEVATGQRPNAATFKYSYGDTVLYYNTKERRDSVTPEQNRGMVGILPASCAANKHLNARAAIGIVLGSDDHTTSRSYYIYDIMKSTIVNGMVKEKIADDPALVKVVLDRYEKENPIREKNKSRLEPEIEESDLPEDEYYEIEKILDWRHSKKYGVELLIRWKNYTQADDSWEPYDDELEAVEEFLKMHPEMKKHISVKKVNAVAKISYLDHIIQAISQTSPSHIDEIEMMCACEELMADGDVKAVYTLRSVLMDKEEQNEDEESCEGFTKLFVNSVTMTQARMQFSEEEIAEAKLREFTLLFPLIGVPVKPGERIEELIPFHTHMEIKPGSTSTDKPKLRARSTGGGNRQKIYPTTETSSGCVNQKNVDLFLAVAAQQREKLAVADITSAFLNAKMPEDLKVAIRIDKKDTELLLQILPEWKKFVRHDGTIHVLLQRALYGIKQAPMLFFNHLKETLITAGYVQSAYDPCIYSRRNGKDTIAFCVHVDDFLFRFKNELLLDEALEYLEAKYGKLKVQRGTVLSYKGTKITVMSDGEIRISQQAAIEEICAQYAITSGAVTPSTVTFFDESEDNTPIPVQEFQSKLFQVLYPARISRVDILKETISLTRKAANPVKSDDYKLTRILQYLYATSDVYRSFFPTSTQIHVYADASHGIHPDGKGHDGICMSLGPNAGFFHVESGIQKLVSHSSTESELMTLDKAMTQVAAYEYLLEEWGLYVSPTLVFQDNQSTIRLTATGYNSLSKTKHVALRFFYVKQVVDSGRAEIIYLQTDKMCADILTKVLIGTPFRIGASVLLNCPLLLLA